MANQMYTPYGGSSLSVAYSSRLSAGADHYYSDPSLGGSRYPTGTGMSAIGGTGSLLPARVHSGSGIAPDSWSGLDGFSSEIPGVKKPVDALYHATGLGTHNAIGQSEALYATNPLAKRPRYESSSSVPIYPQRPGEKDCAHYMLTRTCKFGDSCKFDHPLWVPEGGIPDWKEIPAAPSSEALPVRPGEPDCPYFLKTQKCKFGPRCKFNHPKEEDAGGAEINGKSILPERSNEPVCSFYMKTGKCKFGANCKFHHPKDIQVPPPQDPSSGEQNGFVAEDGKTTSNGTTKPFTSFTPALLHNSKGLPIRPGETDCPFYLKTGSCKYGATCRFNHPDRKAINPSVAAAAAALGQTLITSPAPNLSFGIVNTAANLLPNVDPRFGQTSLQIGTVYPQRPGQTECDYYMKTGECKFGERCKFHHPIDRTTPGSTVMKAAHQNVKLTLAGLPRREGAVVCSFYMKTGTCMYGATCRFDHPPPGEAVAMAAGQAGATSVAEENQMDKTGSLVPEQEK